MHTNTTTVHVLVPVHVPDTVDMDMMPVIIFKNIFRVKFLLHVHRNETF